jgi:Rieske Fe-S protein
MQPPATDTAAPHPRSGRRGFFRWLTYGLGAVATALVGVPVVGYFFGTRQQKTEWLSLGAVKNFPLGETRLVDFTNKLAQPWDGMVARTAVYVRREGKSEFLVFAVNCAHLGCPVSWFPESGLFMCPCHGGVYYANGERASGPPPRGLFHCVWKIENGNLMIQAPHYPTLQDTLRKQG